MKELAELMEYEPNSYAINLRTNKSFVFGLIVPVIANQFYDSFISAVEEDARKAGYSLLILQSADDPLQEAENLKLCKHYRVDGIFISVTADSCSDDLFLKYQQAGIPILFFDKVSNSNAFDTICMADEEAAGLAAQTIIQHEKENVLALFGNPELSISKKRKKAFLDEMINVKYTLAVQAEHALNSLQAQELVKVELAKKRHPDTIFCMSDELLIGAMKAIHKSGLRVPEDVAVLAISNGFIPGLFNPEITYIETSGYELGKQAIKRMLENMLAKTEPVSIIIPSRLVAGGSM